MKHIQNKYIELFRPSGRSLADFTVVAVIPFRNEQCFFSGLTTAQPLCLKWGNAPQGAFP